MLLMKLLPGSLRTLEDAPLPAACIAGPSQFQEQALQVPATALLAQQPDHSLSLLCHTDHVTDGSAGRD